LNTEVIVESSVVAPWSVIFGEMALFFSLTWYWIVGWE
jgi:hypothetical protein